jgi:3-deoxy-D-manno-octulosonic-acid transferase
MRRPAGLALYLALTARRRAATARGEGERPRRPRGDLIWLHAERAANLPAAVELTRRLTEERPKLTLLLTAPGEAPLLPRRALHQPLPPEEPAALAAFLAHWRPDAIAQIGGPLSPVLLSAAGPAAPFHLIQPELPPPAALRLIPGLGRQLFAPLARILAPDAGAARRLRRLAGPAAAIETLAPLEPVPEALACNEAEREAMAATVTARPVWLAAGLPEIELPAVIEAHRAALRLAHRLALIVVPETPAEGAAMASRMAEAEGWITALRSTDDDLGEDCQVYIADTEGELGLWYRLAPITYLGGSLLGAGSLRSPYEPAALGSAILHGARPGAHGAAFSLLARAHATREVRSAAELGEAVGDLLAADRAAALAHDAWAASTAGAEVIDRVARLLLGTLDAHGAEP